MKNGLPFGGNITGRVFEDLKVLQLGQLIEKHSGLKGKFVKGE